MEGSLAEWWTTLCVAAPMALSTKSCLVALDGSGVDGTRHIGSGAEGFGMDSVTTGSCEVVHTGDEPRWCP